EKLEIPVFRSIESKDKVENLLLTVSTTDTGGRSAGDPGYEGANREGECRIYFNNVTPVTSQELYDRAFERLDSIVQREGGIEAIRSDPDKIPQVHIRGDVNAPWRCVAGAIFNVQAAGYPTVGFISNQTDPNPL
ncbi:MAG: biopolymer transporter ExbD, partial [Proteobacteria bacterium]